MKFLSALSIIAIICGPSLYVLTLLPKEVNKFLPLVMWFSSSIFACVLIILLNTYVDKKIEENEIHNNKKQSLRGAQKLFDLIVDDPKLFKIIDVEIPIFNNRGEEIGHGYGEGAIQDLIQKHFDL